MSASQLRTIPSDSHILISFDLQCISCGYNLRTLQYAGSCPECGRLVSLSLPRSKLLIANPVRMRQIHQGATLLIAAMLAAVLLQALPFLLWPFLPAWLVAKNSPGLEVFTLVFGFGFASTWFASVWLLTAPRHSGGRASRRKARRDDLPKAILILSLIPFLSTIATFVLVGDVAAGTSAFPELHVGILVVSVAGSVFIGLAALLLLCYLRMLVRREICRGLHLLLTILIKFGAICGGLWTALLFVSEHFAVFFAYPPLSIPAGIAVRAASFSRTAPALGIAPPGSGGTTSILAGLIAFGTFNLLTLGGFAMVLWALMWFRKLLGEAIRAEAAHTDSGSKRGRS